MGLCLHTVQDILKRLHTKVSANGNMSQYYTEHFKETIHTKVSANGNMSQYCPKNLNEQEIWTRYLSMNMKNCPFKNIRQVLPL